MGGITANLTNANLSNSYLFETNLTGANLSGADLTEADLSGVTGLTCDQVKSAMGKPRALPEYIPESCKPKEKTETKEMWIQGRHSGGPFLSPNKNPDRLVTGGSAAFVCYANSFLVSKSDFQSK